MSIAPFSSLYRSTHGIDNGAIQVPRCQDAQRWFPPFTRPGVPGQPRTAMRACAHDKSERGRIEVNGRSRDGEEFRRKG